METPKQKLGHAIIEQIFEVEMKPLLEENDEIADLYDNGKISHDDFYDLLGQFKLILRNKFNETIYW